MANPGETLGSSGQQTGSARFDEDHDLKRELRELSQETLALMRQELQLVKAEISEKTDFLKEQIQLTTSQVRHEVEHAKADLAVVGKKAGVGAGMFGAATLLGLGAFAAVTTFLITAIAAVTATWIAALLVAIIYGAAAGGLAMAGRKKVKEVGAPVPETLGRFKDLFSFRTRRIKGELQEIPQQALGSLNSVKDDLKDAWQRGSQHEHESWS